jgi:hypothetical protein
MSESERLYATGSVYEAEYEGPPLLVIELRDMQSVPVIKYKGKEIDGKLEVNYHWKTKGLEDLGEHEISLEHVDKEQQAAEKINLKRLFT